MAATRAKVMDLADQIQRLGTNQRTGTLVVTGPAGTAKHFFFGNGRVEMVAVPRKRYLLGEALFKTGKIERTVLLKLIAESFKEKGNVLGTFLMDKGSVKKEDLLDAMAFQLQEEINDLFLWEDLDFKFNEGPPDPVIFPPEMLASKVALNTEMLVIEAARRTDEWDRIKHHIPSFSDVYTPVAGSGDITGWDQGTQLVFANINGRHTVDKLLEQTRLDRFSILQCLAALKEHGLVRSLDGNELAALAVKVQPVDARRDVLKRAIELGTTDTQAQLHLAEAQEELQDRVNAGATYLAYARAAGAKGDIKNAQYGFQMVLGIDPGNLAALHEMSLMLVAGGAKAEAVAALVKAGGRQVELGAHANAKGLYEEAVRIDPENIEAQIGLGRYYETQSDPSQANIEFARAAELLMAAGRKEEAVGIFRHMLEVDADCMDAGLGLGQTLGELGKNEDAVKEYQKLAESLNKAGGLSGAITGGFLMKVYENMIALDPGNRGAREWLAKAYESKNKKDKAVAQYRKLAEIYAGAGEHARADEALVKLCELMPDDHKARIELAHVKMARRMREEALSLLVIGAETLIQQKKTAPARELLGEALRIDPFQPRARAGLANLMALEGRKDEGARLLVRTGRMCRGGGLTKEAVQLLTGALAFQPGDPEALRELAAIYLEEGAGFVPVATAVEYIQHQLKARNFGDALAAAQKLAGQDKSNQEHAILVESARAAMAAMAAKPAPVKPVPAAPSGKGASAAGVDEAEDQAATIQALKHVVTRSRDDIGAREKLADLYRQKREFVNAAQMLREAAALYKKKGQADLAVKRTAEADSLVKQLGLEPGQARLASASAPAVIPAAGKPAPVRPVGAPIPAKPAVAPEPARPGSRTGKTGYDVPMSIEDFEKGFK
ncbi:MAG: DUF4388 domain-containing protein [Planctomycetota bacterium]